MERNVCAEPERLDVFLSEADEALSRSAAQRLIRSGMVQVNGSLIEKTGCMLRVGDAVEWEHREPEPETAAAEDIPLDIIYEDADICVLNKPQGMVVHPAPGHSSGTLVNALMYHFSDLPVIGGAYRPGIVHRIDKMTSGLLVIARSDAAHRALSEQFKSHTAHRSYLAIAEGNFREDSGTVTARIGRHPTDRKRMAVTKNGRDAVTHWAVLSRFSTQTLLALKLETGRTHQIRVHLASIQHPISGDAVYGRAKNTLGLDGQALHGYRLSLVHPLSGERMCFYAPPPERFMHALKALGSSENAVLLFERADALLHEKEDLQ